MERVRATVALDCTLSHAETALPAVFESRRDARGTIRWPLRVSLEDFGLPLDVDLEHQVEIHVERRRDEQNLNEVYAIDWRASDDGPLPDFQGHMILWAEDDPSCCYLELDGTYEPPLGRLVGAAFDATIGHLIAERTVKVFLDDVADAVSAKHSGRT
ncbi:MAG: hypothetical protein KGN02_14000 [bacterium]|nr:hypothetical protein [bacterium]